MSKEEKGSEEMDTGNNEKESDRYEYYVLVEHDHQGSEEKEDEKDEKPQKKQKREDSDFLNIKKGDVIKVIFKDESGWTWGQKYNTKLKQAGSRLRSPKTTSQQSRLSVIQNSTD
ncbi:unnamed protein product [Blepharisma stoltei]|uniref:SH3 domain-containing protein n=1 Tax=Blepharisma stoltei TaxID=1481888 RepID=A0AAU9JQP7_9CILI|nr:unnamed protein product [Blepharisma stoltei]